MTPKLANKRYMKLMMTGTLGYAVTLIGATFLIKKMDVVTPGSIILGLVPGIFVLIMLYSIWRYLTEVDEGQRYFLTRQLVGASFFVLAISGVWGLMEMMMDTLPKLPVFWIFPLFFFAFGLQSMIGPNRGMNCA